MSRTIVQFPLTEKQQAAYDAWVRAVRYVNNTTEEQAEVIVSNKIFAEDLSAYRYWAKCTTTHFCKYPTINAGWYSCTGCYS